MFKFIAAAVFGLVCLSVSAFAADYSTVIQDLPLMNGMTEIQDAAVTFDTPAGRVLETAAEVLANARQIHVFYASALPPLGWKQADSSAMVYTRGHEMMTIEVNTGSAPYMSRVLFRLGPVASGKE